MNTWFKIALFTLLGIFAAIGIVFTAVFIAMQFGLFNVKGAINTRNQFFLGSATATATSAAAVQAVAKSQPCDDPSSTVCNWSETPEWSVVSGGLAKDASLINSVSRDTGVDARMIAAVVIPEQIRFFTSEREVFKRYFEPLKILGSLSQFSLGVSGIKQETANQIEQNANDPSSPFYPGSGYGDLIAYGPGASHDSELYSRLTNDKDHYFSYLYTALYIKEVEAQWLRAGFDISHNPEAVVTLFNIGFQSSHPNASPQAAGAPIAVGGKIYAFGILGADFYHSDLLSDIFPK